MRRQYDLVDSPTQSIDPPPTISFDPKTAHYFLSVFFIACLFISVIFLTFLSIYNLLLRPKQSPPSGDDDEHQRKRDNGLLTDADRLILTVKPYQKGEDQEVETCDVCLDDFEEGKVVKMLPRCGHMYHPPCIDEWIRQLRSCPHCREGVMEEPDDQMNHACNSDANV